MRTKMYTLLLAAVLMVFTGCCAHPKAKAALKDAIAINKGHMTDDTLPASARSIAQDNYDLDSQVLFNLDGTPLPADTKARMDARKKSGDK